MKDTTYIFVLGVASTLVFGMHAHSVVGRIANLESTVATLAASVIHVQQNQLATDKLVILLGEKEVERRQVTATNLFMGTNAFDSLTNVTLSVASRTTNEVRFEFVSYQLSPTNGPSISLSDDAIRRLVSTGAVCDVVGHKWFTPTFVRYAFDDTGTSYRRCSFCNTVQSKREGDWK